MQKRLSLNLGQDELISERNELNDSWINNDDTYINFDYFIGGLVRESWFQKLSNTSDAVNYDHENLKSACSDRIICERI